MITAAIIMPLHVVSIHWDVIVGKAGVQRSGNARKIKLNMICVEVVCSCWKNDPEKVA